MNEQLALGRYFFCDVKKEGILLYDSGRFKLAKPKKLTVKARRQLAEENFEEWLKKANEKFEKYKFFLQKNYFNECAFELHQVTESLYSAIQLVFITYKPTT